MIYECFCGTTFKYEDGDHANGFLTCPGCGSEDLKLIPILLTVDSFDIQLETLANADWNRSNHIMESARIEVINEVIKNLDSKDRDRLYLYQDKNNPCKEVE